MKTTDIDRIAAWTTPLIVNAALTGAVAAKSDNPTLPVTVEEIVADARRCQSAGASIVHVHARDKCGQPSCDAGIYREIVDGIRRSCPGLLVCTSTSGRFHTTFQERSSCLSANPDFASLTLGSLNFENTGASVNEPQMIKDLARCMRNHTPRVIPELEFFDVGMINYAKRLVRDGIIEPPFYCNILLGSPGSLDATVANLANCIDSLPNGFTWSAAGIGRKNQTFVNTLAIVMGGHVRIGLEDNLHLYPENKLATNAQLVETVVKIALTIGRGIASPETARQIISGQHQ